MEIKEKGNKVTVKFNFFEIPLTFRTKLSFEYGNKEILSKNEAYKIFSEYKIRNPGLSCFGIAKIGTFYKVKNNRVYKIWVFIYLLFFLLLIFAIVFKMLNIVLIGLVLLLILGVLFCKTFIGNKAFFYLTGRKGKTIVYKVKKEEENDFDYIILNFK